MLRDAGRAIKAYRPTLEELLVPPEKAGITLENVVVTLRQFYSYYGFCNIHWLWERVRKPAVITHIFPHIEVASFKELIDRKKAKGYKVKVWDGVLALLISSRCATKSFATGFLDAMSIDYHEFRGITKETVGEALSRLEAKGWLDRGMAKATYVLREKVYCMSPQRRTILRESPTWWLRVKPPPPKPTKYLWVSILKPTDTIIAEDYKAYGPYQPRQIAKLPEKTAKKLILLGKARPI